jgi:hypothetical protein
MFLVAALVAGCGRGEGEDGPALAREAAADLDTCKAVHRCADLACVQAHCEGELAALRAEVGR